MLRSETQKICCYDTTMRQKISLSQNYTPDWYIREWMSALRVTQAKLARETGWSKATTNDICHGRTSYYRKILNEAAAALKVKPYELLLHPSEAMALRGFFEAVKIAKNNDTLNIQDAVSADSRKVVGK